MSPTSDAPLVQRFFERALRYPDALMFAVYPRGATVPAERITWGGMSARVRAVGAHLLRAGVQRGDRVAVHAGNRPLWPTLDLALQSIGAVGVGLYPSSTPAQLDQLLRDSGSRWLFTDSREQAVRFAQSPPAGVVLDGVVVDTQDVTDPHLPARCVPWHVFVDEGASLLAAEPALGRALDERLTALAPDDLAALIYTSGSTGEPKGACISHRYFSASAAAIAEVLGLTADDRGLSFLPYSHAAERVFGTCTRLHMGMPAALIEDPADLFAVAAHFEPTLLGGLPRVFEKLYEAADVARREGRDPRAALTARIGTRVRLATSGGAPLPAAVGEALQALGLPVCGAYGQTEHLCVAMNRPQRPRFDVVGAPMPGTEVRLAPDGELLVRRSALTFHGYWQRPDETARAFTDDGEWLRTGDLAVLTDDGALRITGRVKELLALSTGRKVAPLPIEAALTASPFVAHAVCCGEGRKYLSAVLSPRRASLEAWAAAHHLTVPWPQLLEAPAVRQLFTEAVQQVNTALARTDRVQQFVVTPVEFTAANGLLTPTMKVVREAVLTAFATEIESLYATPPPASGPVVSSHPAH